MAYCDEYVALISAALDGALSPDEQAKLEAHLAACPACRALHDDLNELHRTLGELPAVEVPPGLTERIMEAVATEAATAKVVPLPVKKPAPFRWRQMAATAAMLALVLAGAWSMSQTGVKDRPDSISLEKRATVFPIEDADAANRSLPPPCSETTEGGTADIIPQLQSLPSPEAVPETVSMDPNELQTVSPASADTRTKQTDSGEVPQAVPSPAMNEVAVPQPEPSPEAPTAVIQTAGLQVVPFRSSAPPPNTTEDPAGTGEELPPPDNGLLGSAFPGSGPEDGLPDPVSEDDEPEETLPLTPREAMALVVKLCPVLEDAALIDTENRLALETPLVLVGESGCQQVSTQLEYLGLTPNHCYHEFWLYSFLLDDPETGLAHSSTLNFFAVPIGGGEVLVQRSKERDLNDEDVWNAYLAGIDAYFEATRKVTPDMTEAELAAMDQVQAYLEGSDDYVWNSPTTRRWTDPAWEFQLTYSGLCRDEQYYLFELYETPLFAEQPEAGTRFVNFYAVPVDGGAVIEGSEENHDLFMTHE